MLISAYAGHSRYFYKKPEHDPFSCSFRLLLHNSFQTEFCWKILLLDYKELTRWWGVIVSKNYSFQNSKWGLLCACLPASDKKTFPATPKAGKVFTVLLKIKTGTEAKWEDSENNRESLRLRLRKVENSRHIKRTGFKRAPPACMIAACRTMV